MRRAVSVVVIGCVLSGFLACKDDDAPAFGGRAPPEPTGSAIVRFTPSCGSPGDVIDVRIGKQRENVEDAKCTAEDQFASFFTPSVESKPSAVQAAGDDCSLTVTVPDGATTGKIRVTRRAPPLTEPLTQESDDVFTIPCPADAGPDAPSAQPPLGGVLSVNSPATGVGTANGAFFGAPLTAAQIAALAYEEYLLLSRIAPLGIPAGSCGKPTPPGPEPAAADKPATVAVGDVTLRTGGASLATFAPQNPRTDTFYGGDIPAVARDAFIELLLTGGSGFAPTTLPNALRAPPTFSVLTPDVSSGDITAPQNAPLTFTYPMLTESNVRTTLELTRISTGDTTTCVLPPAAGTFTVPGNAIGAAGTVIATMRSGYVTEATKDARRYVFATSAPIDFTINVQ